jgi:hypothetical protein
MYKMYRILDLLSVNIFATNLHYLPLISVQARELPLKGYAPFTNDPTSQPSLKLKT